MGNFLLNLNLNIFYFLIVKKMKAANQRWNKVNQIRFSSRKKSTLLNYIWQGGSWVIISDALNSWSLKVTL